MSAVLAALLLAASPSSDDCSRVVRDRFEQVGRRAPLPDPRLTRAAQALARIALDRGPARATSARTMTAAISEAGGWDADPVTVVLRAEKGRLLEALRAEPALTASPASVVGVGVAEDDVAAAVFVLLVQRKAELQDTPRSLAPGKPTSLSLCGALVAPLTSGEWFITRPGGTVDRARPRADGGAACASTAFVAPGRHTVELLARGPRGPEVAALFFVFVGRDAGSEEPDAEREPDSDDEARAQIRTRVGALRASLGLGGLEGDRALEAIAQGYAERLTREHYFGHVAPDGSTLEQRLREAHYDFATAGENLGLARGPLEAHANIEQSPAHRRNLLEPAHAVLGIGLARSPSGQTVLVELLASSIVGGDGDPVARATAALQTARTAHGLPLLQRNAVLDAIAQEHAHAVLRAQTPKIEIAGARRPYARVFELLDQVESAAVDVFVATSPLTATESVNLLKAQHSLVGIGLVTGTTDQFGSDRYWMVVIYAGVRS